MKTIAQRSSIEQTSSMTENIQQGISALFGKFEPLAPRGWHIIIRVNSAKHQFDYLIDLASDAYTDLIHAVSIMKTLEKFPDRSYTGGRSIEQIGDDLQMIMRQNHPLFQKILGYKEAEEITRNEREQLSKRYGYTTLYGGFRIPFADQSQNTDLKGELLIATDGSNNEHINLALTLSVFQVMKNVLSEQLPAAQIIYDTRGFDQDLNIQGWMKVLNITA